MNDEQLDRLARGLRHEWDSPGLWTSIERRLRSDRRRKLMLWLATGAAAAGLAILMVAWPKGRNVDPANLVSTPLLTERALADVEEAEQAYRKSIDKLAAAAGTKLARPTSPLLAAYAERIKVLDAAIAELDREIEHNGFNTHLRLQMAALYRSKQETLERMIRNGEAH